MPTEDMGLFAGLEAGLLEKAAAQASAPANLVSAVMSALQFGSGGGQSYAQLVDAYKGWVYTSVDKIAKTIATRPLRLYTLRKKNGQKLLDPSGVLVQFKQIGVASERTYALKNMGLEKREVLEHPFLDLIHRPNGIMSRMILWYETMIRMELGGFCGWYLPSNGLGLPGEIWPLPLTKGATLKPRVSGSMQIEEWIYQDGSVRKSFKPQEILPLKYPNPSSPWEGFSPLMAQQHPYDIDLFLMQQQRALLKNMGIPGVHLHTDQPLTKERLTEILEQIREQWGDATRSGRPMVTHSGLAAEKTGWSNREMRIGEIAKYSREKTITSYDLSEAKLGLEVPSNRANMEVLDETFEKECIGPKCTLLEEQINTFFLPRYDQGIFAEFDQPDIGDRDFNLRETEMELRNFVTVVNDVRARKGLPPVPWGSKPWIPLGVSQEGSESAPPPPPKGNGVETQEEKASRTDRRNRRWQLFISRTAPWERLMTGQMQGYFKHQGEEVIARLHRLGHQVEAQYAGWSRKAVQKHIAEKGVGDNINIDKKAEAARLKLLFTPPVTTMVGNGGARVLRELGAAVVFNVNDPKVKKWIGTRMDMFSEAVAGTTFDDIKVILRQGFSEGKPLSAIADTLREKFDSYDKYRAPLISRTEVMAGNNMADILAIRQAGIEEKVLKTWITAGDENVRPTHMDAGARYEEGIPIGEMFQVGDDEMDAPGNGSDPAETINCRCAMGYEKA
jgi:phage portal protein BeeE